MLMLANLREFKEMQNGGHSGRDTQGLLGEIAHTRGRKREKSRPHLASARGREKIEWRNAHRKRDWERRHGPSISLNQRVGEAAIKSF